MHIKYFQFGRYFKKPSVTQETIWGVPWNTTINSWHIIITLKGIFFSKNTWLFHDSLMTLWRCTKMIYYLTYLLTYLCLFVWYTLNSLNSWIKKVRTSICKNKVKKKRKYKYFFRKFFLKKLFSAIFWGSKSRNSGESTKFRPEIESRNSGDHEFWNHEMRRPPVVSKAHNRR